MTTDEATNAIAVFGPEELERSIAGFNPSMASFLQQIGLPTENILSPVDERKKVIFALEDALGSLPMEERERAYYLTKFTVAVSVGLFDGALNYLWNETVHALRRLVAGFDLAYFFSVAEQISSRNRRLSSVDHLVRVDDHDLLEACRRIGLISDVNYKRLEHINFMRNCASAAHPNDTEIDGFEMLSWLANCLRYAITAEPDHSVISIHRLLVNIRREVVPSEDFPVIGADIETMSQERIDDLLWTLFGMYVDPRQTPAAKTNIRGVGKYVWSASSEDRKYEIGARYGVFRKNAEIARKDAAHEFLETVDGQSYRDEDSLAGELIEKLGVLKSVHFGMNNFYNEFPVAKDLQRSLPVNGVVPRAARSSWVKVICLSYTGNGHGHRQGVDEAALPYYERYINGFSEAEMVEFLHLMGDAEFTSAFDRSMVDGRVRDLARLLKSKSENIHTKRALDLIAGTPPRTLSGMHQTTEYKEALKLAPKHS